MNDANPNSHTDARIDELRSKAARARGHAIRLGDTMAATNLTSYAEQLEAEAAKLEAEARNTISEQARVATGEPSTTQVMATLGPAKPEEPTDDQPA